MGLCWERLNSQTISPFVEPHLLKGKNGGQCRILKRFPELFGQMYNNADEPLPPEHSTGSLELGFRAKDPSPIRISTCYYSGI